MRILFLGTQLDIGQDPLASYLSDQHQVLIRTSDFFLSNLTSFDPDIIVFNDELSGIDQDGIFKLIRRIKEGLMGGFVQVVVLTRNLSRENRLRYFRAGTDAFLESPIDFEEVSLRFSAWDRMRKQLDNLWNAQFQANDWYDKMETIVRQKTNEINLNRNTTVFVIAKLAESRSSGTGRHLERIRDYCDVLTRELFRFGMHPEINGMFIEDIYWASPLHDIGKIVIPDAILMKQGPLSSDEFEIMKQHSVVGAHTLLQAMNASGYSSFLSMAIDIARYHHERYNGLGYPDRINGNQIPIAAQIVAVADVFDALSTSRVYKSALDPRTVKEMIAKETGTHFNPSIVAAFIRKFGQFLEVYNSHRDAPPESNVMQDNFLHGIP